MSFLFARSPPTPIPDYTGIVAQTAVSTAPIGINYGFPVVAAVLINLPPASIRSTKNNTKSKGQQQQRSATGEVIASFGEGPWVNIPGIGIFVYIRVNGSFHPAGNAPTGTWLDAFEIQSTLPPTYALWFNEGDQPRTYKDTICSFLVELGLGAAQNPSAPQIEIVGSALLSGSSPLVYNPPDPNVDPSVPLGLLDADPAQVFVDYLTNFVYGAGFDPSLIWGATGAPQPDGIYSTANATNPAIGDATLQTYCQAYGFAFSVSLYSSEAANSVIQRWCELLVVAPVWTGTTLKFIPYMDTPQSENPNLASGPPINAPMKYFVPNVTPLFDLTNDDFVQATGAGEDPVTFARSDIVDVKPIVRLSFKNRGFAFNDWVVEAKDENSLEIYALMGKRVDNLKQASEFPLIDYASRSVQTILQRQVGIRRKGTFKLGPEFSMLDPMDVVTIPHRGRRFSIRITAIDEDDKGISTYEFEELGLGTAAAATYQRQGSSAQTFNPSPSPPSVNP